MEKAYDFDIPEDISEIPDETPEEIEGNEHVGMKSEKAMGNTSLRQTNFSIKHGMSVRPTNPI